MFCPCTSPFTALVKLFKMVFTNMTTTKLLKQFAIASIIGLIVISVYYLNSTLEFLKKLIDHINDADMAFAKHAARNLTISKMIIEPLQRNAHDMYQKNEAATILNIVSYSTLIALSIAGLIAAFKDHPIFLVVYGVGLDLVYTTSFLYISRLKSSVCAYIVFVSILVYIHARHLSIKQSVHKVSILQANSDRELIKNEDCKCGHASEVV